MHLKQLSPKDRHISNILDSAPKYMKNLETRFSIRNILYCFPITDLFFCSDTKIHSENCRSTLQKSSRSTKYKTSLIWFFQNSWSWGKFNNVSIFHHFMAICKVDSSMYYVTTFMFYVITSMFYLNSSMFYVYQFHVLCYQFYVLYYQSYVLC